MPISNSQVFSLIRFVNRESVYPYSKRKACKHSNLYAFLFESQFMTPEQTPFLTPLQHKNTPVCSRNERNTFRNGQPLTQMRPAMTSLPKQSLHVPSL